MNSIYRYITGFVLSLGLTSASFGLVWWYLRFPESFARPELLFPALVGLAVVQLYVQVFFFLHVGRGRHAGWNAAALSFTLFIVVVIAGGSIWIMNHLEHASHTAEEIFESEAILPPHAH